MNSTLILEMIEREGRMVYIDPHGAEWHIVPAEAYQRFLCWSKMQTNCAHIWQVEPVGKTNLTRMVCRLCGAKNYGYGEDE